MQNKKIVIIALLIPILSLFGIVVYNQHLLMSGKEVVLPIEAYDPRDMLSGHYLLYTINYGMKDICKDNNGKQAAYLCLDPKQVTFDKPHDCATLIVGRCEYSHFKAGIERFYISEVDASSYQQILREDRAQVVLSVTADGHALVKDLLIDGKSISQ